MQATSHAAMPSQTDAPRAALRSSLGWLTLALLWVATFALSHGYKGVDHDSRLYILQALGHLYRDTLGQDVFLRFGSQDQFTIFSPLFAAVISWIGVEPAAALLTLTSQLAVLLAAALLARQLMPRHLVPLGVTVLLAIPGTYGAEKIFSCIEPFLTPRMGAEALVLGSLAAALSSRPRLAAALVVAAALIHPVMAAAGVAALLYYYVGIARPRITAAVIAAGLLVLIVAGLVLPPGRFGVIDREWLGLIRGRSSYAFVTTWTLRDWAPVATTLTTLIIGARTLSQQPALLCRVTLLASVSGLVLSSIACDLAHLALFTQLQAWRWQWLAIVSAALLLPATLVASFQNRASGKITALLLATAWIAGATDVALPAAAAALASLALRRWSERAELKWLVWGAGALLMLELLSQLADNLQFLEAHYADPRIPLWIRELASCAADGVAPVAIALLAVWLVRARQGVWPLAGCTALLLALCAALTPDAWRRWTQQQFDPERVATFAPWRQLIPPDAEVFWSESATQVWLLLQRPSYLSVAQTSGMMFSRTTALELERRAKSLEPAIPASNYLVLSGGGAGIAPATSQLEQVCAKSQFDYLVTSARLKRAPLAELPASVWHSSGGLRLYHCH
jgi:hypothetical protein